MLRSALTMTIPFSACAVYVNEIPSGISFFLQFNKTTSLTKCDIIIEEHHRLCIRKGSPNGAMPQTPNSF